MAGDKQNTEDVILQGLARHVNCLSDENRNSRKRAMEGIKKETSSKKPPLDPDVFQTVFTAIIKPLLKILSDPVEKCRELSITLVTDSIEIVPDPHQFLHVLIPVFVQRLGQKDIIEESEELRLLLVELLTKLVVKCQKYVSPFLDDIIRILQRTIVDPFPEVKKQSCKCSSAVAKAIPEYFHMQSESLIKPLMETISHQHAKVRIEVILTVGDVLQYGNGKNVEDVVSHLAQRFFDHAPTVRAAVTQVVGNWLLDLPDRYSFHHKLMPLLLTSITDELPDIQQQADSLWHDVGIKYAGENEEELKDQMDFLKPDPDHYPAGVERPNLGCRVLMYRHFSKIVSGVVNDVTDWVAATRIKSIQLLYTLLLNEESNVTQHLPKVLQGLYKAAGDEEKEVTLYATKCALLVGYFVEPEVWCKMVMQGVKTNQTFHSVMILANIILGSRRDLLKPYLGEITGALEDPHMCHIADDALQSQLLCCVENIIVVIKTDCKEISLPLFKIILAVLSLHKTEHIRDESKRLMGELATSQELNSSHQLYETHTAEVIGSLQDYTHWTQHSVERYVFDTLLMEAGSVVGEMLEQVVPVMVVNLKPEKDPEIRLKFFNLLSRLVMNSAQTLDSQNKFEDFVVTVAKDMILPNCVWSAGRVSAVIRTTAVSCLWALLQSGALTKDKLMEVLDLLMIQLKTLLDEDNKNTRIVTCRVLKHIFTTVGTNLDQDKLHNMYPDLLKRMDDSSDDIRIAMCQCFQAYFDCFVGGYDIDLYRAHLEAIYKGLLVHMDDPDSNIQSHVLDVLKKAAKLHPALLMREIDAVKHKHRTTQYCEQLEEHVRSLATS